MKYLIYGPARTASTKLQHMLVNELLAGGHRIAFKGETLNLDPIKDIDHQVMTVTTLLDHPDSVVLKLLPYDLQIDSMHRFNFNQFDKFYISRRTNKTDHLCSIVVSLTSNQWNTSADVGWLKEFPRVTVTDEHIRQYILYMTHNELVISKLISLVDPAKIIYTTYETTYETTPIVPIKTIPTNNHYETLCTNYAEVEAALKELNVR